MKRQARYPICWVLKQQRRKLMDDLHAAQKKVDTIDFMIRSVEQKKEENHEQLYL